MPLRRFGRHRLHELRARWIAGIGGLGLLLGLEACVVHDTAPVNSGYNEAYGYGGVRGNATASASLSVGEPSPYTVSGMPPEPLYEQMSDSPGDGSVWIDGYWHWNGYEWMWVNGRWEREQPGYVYVEPNYDYQGEQYVYTPGYWSQPERVPRGWNVRDHRDGRPRRVAPPVNNVGVRPPIRGTRNPVGRAPVANPGGGTVYIPPGDPGRPQRPPYYDPGGGRTWRPPPPGPVIGRGGAPVINGGAPVINGGAPTINGGATVIDHRTPQPAGGAIDAPPANPPSGGRAWNLPPAAPPSGAPIYVNPGRPGGGAVGRPPPPPPMGRPIYVNPAGPSSSGTLRPPPPAQPGGPIWVNPSGPSVPRPPVNNGGGGAVYRPAAPSNGGVRPGPSAPPPPVGPHAPGPRTNNPRRPQ